MEYMNGSKFSTKDQDNDDASFSCTLHFNTNGGWWFSDCHKENMNGQYHHINDAGGIVWHGWKGPWITMKETWLMIRSRSFTI